MALIQNLVPLFLKQQGVVLNKYKITAVCVLQYSTHKALRIFLEYEGGGDLNKYNILYRSFWSRRGRFNKITALRAF